MRQALHEHQDGFDGDIRCRCFGGAHIVDTVPISLESRKSVGDREAYAGAGGGQFGFTLYGCLMF
jgi:hypothetical protein